MNPFVIAGAVWVAVAAVTLLYQVVRRKLGDRGSMVEASWLDLAMSSIGFGLLFAALAFAVAGIVTIFL
jgi:hypothetical protein